MTGTLLIDEFTFLISREQMSTYMLVDESSQCGNAKRL